MTAKRHVRSLRKFLVLSTKTTEYKQITIIKNSKLHAKSKSRHYINSNGELRTLHRNKSSFYLAATPSGKLWTSRLLQFANCL